MQCSNFAILFDRLVGAGEQLRRHGEAEYYGGLTVGGQGLWLANVMPATSPVPPNAYGLPPRLDRLATILHLGQRPN
jgi:hypothetical protein